MHVPSGENATDTGPAEWSGKGYEVDPLFQRIIVTWFVLKSNELLATASDDPSGENAMELGVPGTSKKVSLLTASPVTVYRVTPSVVIIARYCPLGENATDLGYVLVDKS